MRYPQLSVQTEVRELALETVLLARPKKSAATSKDKHCNISNVFIHELVQQLVSCKFPSVLAIIRKYLQNICIHHKSFDTSIL